MQLPYIIKSWRGGISDESDKGIPGSFKFGYGLDIHKKEDTLSCGQAMQTINESLVTDLINFFVPASDGTTYCFGSSGSIYARSGDGAWNFAYNDENGKIIGAAEWKLSDGNNYLYWATATSVARATMNGSLDLPWAAGVATQDHKTTLENTDWHTMKQAGGRLNITNGNYLATIYYDGSFNAISLNVRPGNILKTLEERDDNVIIGSGRLDKSEEGHLWAWNMLSTNWNQKRKIPVKGVNALINTELSLLQGGDSGEIFYSDFSNVVPLHAIPGGGQTQPGGVSIENDLAVFGFYGGDNPGIWSFGRRMKNRPHSLNYGYKLAKSIAGSSISTIGAVAMIDGELLVSWGTTDGSTSDYGVDSSSSTTKATAKFEGLEFDNNAPHLKKKFNAVKLLMSPLISGTSVSIVYKLDKKITGGDSSTGVGWRYAIFGDGSTTFSTIDAIECEARISDKANIYEVGVELNPVSNSSPEILAITTFLDSNTQTNG